MMTNPPFVFDKPVSPLIIAEMVREYGICIIRGFCADQVEAMNAEFEKVLEMKDPRITSSPAMDGAIDKRFEPHSGLLQQIPVHRALFESETAVRSTEEYFKTEVFLNKEYYFNDNFPTEAPIDQKHFRMHLDKLHTFKWYFYLNDITQDCGPFECIPYTHAINMRTRLRAVEKGLALGQFSNFVSYSQRDVFSCVGPAGTALIFDTDISHRAGWVKPGHFRRIVRNHSFGKAYGEMMYHGARAEDLDRELFFRHF